MPPMRRQKVKVLPNQSEIVHGMNLMHSHTNKGTRNKFTSNNMGILACSTTMKHRNHHHVPSSHPSPPGPSPSPFLFPFPLPFLFPFSQRNTRHNKAKNTDYLCQKGVWHDHCWCCRCRIFPPKYRHSWSNNPLDLVVGVDQLAGSTQTIRFVNIASTKRPSETQVSKATATG